MRKAYTLLDPHRKELVVVRVKDRVALTFIDIHRFGEFRTRRNIDRRLRDDFCITVNITGQCIDLRFPQVAKRAHHTASVAVQSAITDHRLALVAIASHASAHHGCHRRKDRSRARPRLQVLVVDPCNFHHSVVADKGAAFKRMADRFNNVRNRGDHVRRSEVLGQVTSRILRRIRIEARRHVHEIHILRSNRFGIKCCRYSAIDTATCANDHARDMEHFQVLANHEHKRVMNFSDFTRVRL